MGLVSPEFLRYRYNLHLLCTDTLLFELLWLQDPGSPAFLNYGLSAPYLPLSVSQCHIRSVLVECFLPALSEKINRTLENKWCFFTELQ